MFKLFSVRKSQAGVLITLMVLIILGACYFFIYLPGNERIVQERRFRCLRKIDSSLRQKMETAEKQITGLLDEYNKSARHKPTEALATMAQYISGYPKKNFTYLLPEKANQYFEKGQPAYIGNDTAGNKFYLDADSRITLLVKKNGGNAIGIQFEFAQFIKPLLLTDVFDAYIVFINKDKIYEQFPTGLNYTSPDSLLNIKNKVTTPGFRSMQIGETDYKVFSQPVYTSTNNKWIITGLLRNSNYQKEKNQLPLWVLLLLMTSAIVMLVSLPWLKLSHRGNIDKVTVNDGISSMLVSIVLMSFLFFIFFKYHVDINQGSPHYRSHGSKKDILYNTNAYSRNVLASKLTISFTHELISACTLLEKFKAIKKATDRDVRSLGNDTGKYGKLYRGDSNGLDIKKIFWLDENGTEKINLATSATNDPKINYSTRDYFKYAGSYELSHHQFYLDQVYSATEGTFRSVISEKTNKDSVIAMSLTMKSLDDVIMPDGYQFAIISKSGLVLYHSVANRQLLDNLETEFADDKGLLSAIQATSDTSFQAEYYGKLYNIKIKPIAGLPYFTVIFENIEYNNTRDTESFTFTICMLAGMIVFLCIKYGIVFFASAKRSFFKKQRYDTSWIGPHASCHHQYNMAILANLYIIVILIIFFNRCSFLGYLYIVMVAVVATSLVLIYNFARKYKTTDPYKYRLKVRALQWLTVFAAVINISAYSNLSGENFKHFVIFEFLLCIPALAVPLGGRLPKLDKFKLKSFYSWTFSGSYAFMAVTRLVISSGIPAAFFFIYSFNYEQNLDGRYRQLRFANELIKKIPVNGSKTGQVNKYLDSLTQNLIDASGVYFDGLLINTVKIHDSPGIADSLKRVSDYQKEDILTAKTLNAFRLQTSNLEIKTNDLIFSSAGNTAFFSKLNQQSGSKSPLQTFYQLEPGKYLEVRSLSHINYQTPLWRFWIALFAAVIVFYYIVNQVIIKIFSLDLHPTKGWGDLDVELLDDNDFNKMALIVGSPGSNTLDKLTDRIKRGEIKGNGNPQLMMEELNPSDHSVFVLDMILISAENGETDPDWARQRKNALGGHALVLINHFEYNIDDVRVNRIKLDLLELLIAQNTGKVIIISAVHPLIFLDSLSGGSNDNASGNDLGRWYKLLGAFHVLIDPLISSTVPEDILFPEKEIIEETRYSRFLHAMQKIFLKYLDISIRSGPADQGSQQRTADSLIFKLQLISQYFYTDIWQSLTQEEKFILYDLAEDGLVNSFDKFNLSMLMCKGLIINRDGALMLFNKGFRNFILTAIGQKEIDRIKEQVRDNGKWGDLKTPMNLAILAILIFLFASQQTAYSQVITYITALSAGIPALLKLFSMFGSSSSPKTD